VTTPKLQNDPRIKQLAKDLTSPQVAKYISDNFAGSVIPVADRMIVVEGQQNLRRRTPPALDRCHCRSPTARSTASSGAAARASTLLRCLNLLERPDSGRILIDGVDLTN
jgi:hypothetical protein